MTTFAPGPLASLPTIHRPERARPTTTTEEAKGAAMTTAKTVTLTIRRSTLALAATAALTLVATMLLFGDWAWIINGALVLVATGTFRLATHIAAGRPKRATRQPDTSAQTIADAIQDASLRDAVLRDMRGAR